MKARAEPAGDEPPVLRALREFWTGVTDLSAVSLWVCLGSFAMVCAFTAWFFQPQTMAGPLGAYVPRSGIDADAFALVEALQMGAEPQTEPTVAFLGSSAVAQMVGNGRRLERALADLPNGPWRVRVLTTPLQSPLDQLRLLEAVLDGRDESSAPLVVAVGMGLTRMAWSGDRLLDTTAASRIPLASDWADAELARLGQPVPRPLPVWALENSDFVILNGMKSLTRLVLGRPAERWVDSYAVGPRPDHKVGTALSRGIEAGFERRDGFYDLQERLAARVLASPNVSLVFVEEPLAPDFVADHGLGPTLETFRAEVAALAEETGAMFWPIVRDSGLTQDQYFDHLHVLPGPAQATCMDGVAAHLASLRFDGMGR